MKTRAIIDRQNLSITSLYASNSDVNTNIVNKKERFTNMKLTKAQRLEKELADMKAENASQKAIIEATKAQLIAEKTQSKESADAINDKRFKFFAEVIKSAKTIELAELINKVDAMSDASNHSRVTRLASYALDAFLATEFITYNRRTKVVSLNVVSAEAEDAK